MKVIKDSNAHVGLGNVLKNKFSLEWLIGSFAVKLLKFPPFWLTSGVEFCYSHPYFPSAIFIHIIYLFILFYIFYWPNKTE